jgi:hypothetical protein
VNSFLSVCVVHQSVQDGVGDGRVADVVVPLLDGQLAGRDGGAPSGAVLGDLEPVAALDLSVNKEYDPPAESFRSVVGAVGNG